MEPRAVQERLQQYKEQPERYDNRTAKRLQPLESGDVVRVLSKDGFIKKGAIVRKAQHPRTILRS
jgi:anaerobic selenocysteine-containing dehydrogenase